MNGTDVIEVLRECAAMLEGHFLLSSGRHSDRYFQCARLFQYPAKAEAVMSVVAGQVKAGMKSAGLKVDAVAGPAIGGIIAAYELGRLLGVPAFFTERGADGVMSLRRGFEIRRGMNIVIAEDVITTGKSSFEAVRALEALGGKVAALTCVVDRRMGGEASPLPVYPACKIEAGNWEARDCPLCVRGIPAVKPGSRKF